MFSSRAMTVGSAAPAAPVAGEHAPPVPQRNVPWTPAGFLRQLVSKKKVRPRVDGLT